MGDGRNAPRLHEKETSTSKQGPIIRDAAPGTADEWFITTCSHVDESEEINRCAQRRRILFEKLRAEGARFKVAILDGVHAGFIHGVPIRRASWSAVGENLMMIPCLFVRERFSGRGVGPRSGRGASRGHPQCDPRRIPGDRTVLRRLHARPPFGFADGDDL